MYPANALAYSDRIPPTWTEVTQELGKPHLMVETAGGCSWEGRRERIRWWGGAGGREISIDSVSK